MTDFALMLTLWNSGPKGKAQALAMADADRQKALLQAVLKPILEKTK
jgi:hypothetical protein